MTKVTKRFDIGGYEQIIKFLQPTKIIYFIDCNCRDFEFRRIKPIGQVFNIKYFAECCKHLKPLINIYEDEGFKLKQPKPMTGTDKCTKELRKCLIERSNGLCECGCGRQGQEVHRKISKVNGGKYNEDNCVLLNAECHKLITFQKWQSSPGAKSKLNENGGEKC